MTFDVVFVDRVAITEHLFGFEQWRWPAKVTFSFASAQNKAVNPLMAASCLVYWGIIQNDHASRLPLGYSESPQGELCHCGNPNHPHLYLESEQQTYYYDKQ